MRRLAINPQIPSDPQRQLMQGLALFIEKFGTRCDNGGHEVFISFEKLTKVELQAQLQIERGPNGVILRYFPNRLIEGKLVDGGRTELTKTAEADEQK